MERNTDPQKVVIAAELYDELVAMARDSGRYTTSRIDRHVRKFNPTRQAAHQEKVRIFEEKRNQMIREARVFKEQHVGKVVYANVDMRSFTKGSYPVLQPVMVVRIAKDRRLVDVVSPTDEYDIKYKRYTKVSVDTLTLTLPDNYIWGVAEYSKYLVKENGPYDLREEVKERDRKYAEREAELKNQEDRSNRVHYHDVIGGH